MFISKKSLSKRRPSAKEYPVYERPTEDTVVNKDEISKTKPVKDDVKEDKPKRKASSAKKQVVEDVVENNKEKTEE